MQIRDTRGCVCYTTDISYALPTILSASQQAEIDPSCHIVVVFYGVSPEQRALLAETCTTRGIRPIFVKVGDVETRSIQHLRLYIDDIVPEEYGRFLHVDGDTQVQHSLSPLLDVAMPGTTILAAPDPMALIFDRRHLPWSVWGRYFHAIGLSPDQQKSYVNTGLFRIDRTDLRHVREECLRIERRSPVPLMFGQQDALNIGFGDQIGRVSFRWNFPAFFMDHRFETIDSVHVIHFMSNPRPWHGHFHPYLRRQSDVYRGLAQLHPDVYDLMPTLSSWQTRRYRIQQGVKALLERSLWRDATVKERYRVLESQARA